jgi:methylglutaconyl-CoA hydratase
MTNGDTGLSIDYRDGIAVWRIDREDRMNALSRSLVRALGDAARAAASDAAVRAIVLTGTGSRAFCAGADLKERQSMSIDDVRDFLSLYRAVFGLIDALPKPTIAALNGVAFGGGLELALACDFRVAAHHVELGLTETSLGIIPGAGGTQRLTALVGAAKAKELILFARRLRAHEAASLGLVNLVASETEGVLDAAIAFAQPLVSGAPIAISAALAAIDAAAYDGLETGLSVERNQYERTLLSSDRLEALKAFSEKRKPAFRGE